MTNPAKIDCLAIIQPLPGIGDMIVHASHIRAISQHYQAKRTILFTKKSSLGAQYAHLFAINEVHYFSHDSRNLRTDLSGKERKDKKKTIYHTINFIYQFAKMLKHKHIDLVVILHHSSKYAIAARLAGIPQRFGYGYKWQKHFLTQSFQLSKTTIKQLYHTKKCDSFLQQMGIYEKALLPQLIPPAPNRETASVRKNVISLGIGASGIDKQWGEQHFATLCTWITEHSSYAILLCGSTNEQYIVDTILQTIDNKHHHRIAHTCHHSITSIITQMSHTHYYVGNDTGFLHIAVALNKHSVGLFGSPYQAVLDYSPLIVPCTPEMSDEANGKTPGHQHIQYIKPSSVIAKLKQLIDSKSYQHVETIPN